MIQVHQFSRLWEECQKHSKQYIKNKNKKTTETAVTQQKITDYELTMTQQTLQYGGGGGGGGTPTKKQKRLKSKVTIAWLKMKTDFFIDFFKEFNRPFFHFFFN